MTPKIWVSASAPSTCLFLLEEHQLWIELEAQKMFINGWRENNQVPSWNSIPQNGRDRQRQNLFSGMHLFMNEISSDEMSFLGFNCFISLQLNYANIRKVSLCPIPISKHGSNRLSLDIGVILRIKFVTKARRNWIVCRRSFRTLPKQHLVAA